MITKRDPTFQSETDLFKVLTNPARLAILDALREGEQCVCHLEAHLGHRQAYISQHLMILREANLVEDRRDGWNIYYRVTRPEIYVLIDTAIRLSGRERQPVKPVKACPCPHCNPEAAKSPLKETKKP